MLDTLAERIRYAVLCLPREDGAPPPYRQIELRAGLPEGTISSVIAGRRKTVEVATLMRLATALHVEPVWLGTGHGTPPETRLPIVDAPLARDRIERYLRRQGFADERVKLAVAILCEPHLDLVPEWADMLGRLLERLIFEAEERRHDAEPDPSRVGPGTLADRVSRALVPLYVHRPALVHRSIAQGRMSATLYRRDAPAWNDLEERHGLPKGLIGEVLRGERKSLDAAHLANLAIALETSPEWLATGEGDDPLRVRSNATTEKK